MSVFLLFVGAVMAVQTSRVLAVSGFGPEAAYCGVIAIAAFCVSYYLTEAECKK